MVPHITRKKILFLSFSMLLWLSVQGCMASRGWVTEQITPLEGRVSHVEGRVSGAETRLIRTDAQTEKILDRLDSLRLEKRFTLDLKEGANFAFNSTDLTEEARRAIDLFLSDLKETNGTIFLVAGHTDGIGSEDYNYQLGQKRAASVARYLMTRKGINPLQLAVVSYGKSTPLADNASSVGRSKNRRVEILIYKEMITDSAGRQQLELKRAS
ncbi:MAG: OmpA family protein [Candidatus Tectomicrobia bacterium]|nr:OmpA family protein [Candidatus Tectomicrobia bacterium]